MELHTTYRKHHLVLIIVRFQLTVQTTQLKYGTFNIAGNQIRSTEIQLGVLIKDFCAGSLNVGTLLRDGFQFHP